jgi:integrase
MSGRDEFLTFKELKKIESLKLKGREKHIRDTFLFACYTGFRYSDLIELKTEDLK